MKKVICLFFCISPFINAFSQVKLDETAKLASLCKIWGFLKYYHPKVARGKIDWDDQLIKKIPQVTDAATVHSLNMIYCDWIKELGKIKKYKTNRIDEGDTLTYNLDLRWIDDRNEIEDSLRNLLNFIKKNRNHRRNHYVQKAKYGSNPEFINEKPYKGFVFPSADYRLLGLFRYWNIINYFYPYKYVIGSDWNTVLDEMIPKFKYASDTNEYHLLMLQLTTRINDSHAFFHTKYATKFKKPLYVPFSIDFIDNKAVVDGFYSDSLSLIDNMRKGDAIVEINGRSIDEINKDRRQFYGASNEATKLSRMRGILVGDDDSLKILFNRDGKLTTKTIHRYSSDKYPKPLKKRVEVCKMLDDNIGYINMGELQLKQVDSVMPRLMKTKAIIFDIRNYPNGTLYKIANYLNPETKKFVKFTEPDLTYPGVFRYTEYYFCGRKNKNYYKGKVVILFNESTISHAEFTCMALQTAPNVISIGSQTCGADGSVTTITFPGGYETWITGIGVFYPDGRQTQRIGIVPDIEVKRTIEGIRSGKDEVLDRAIEYINNGK